MLLALLAQLAMAAAAAAGLAAVGAAAPAFNATAPRHLHLAFTEDPTGMLFSWATGTPIYLPPAPPGTPNATHPAVRLGTAPGAYTLLFTSTYSLEYWGIGDVTHRVNASGLAPRTRYYYVAGDAELQQWSAEATFMSRPPTGSEEVLDFAGAGDCAGRAGLCLHHALRGHFLRRPGERRQQGQGHAAVGPLHERD